jgi:hypothetical protein
MPKYMTRDVFRSACFLLASYYQDTAKYEQIIAGIQDSYRKAYPGDDFVPDLRDGVTKLREMLEGDKAVKTEDDKRLLFYAYYQISKEMEPDGSKRKKFLGLRGGTLFSGSHPNPTNRVHDLTMEFSGYMLHYPTFTVLPEARRLASQGTANQS